MKNLKRKKGMAMGNTGVGLRAIGVLRLFEGLRAGEV